MFVYVFLSPSLTVPPKYWALELMVELLKSSVMLEIVELTRDLNNPPLDKYPKFELLFSDCFADICFKVIVLTIGELKDNWSITASL